MKFTKNLSRLPLLLILIISGLILSINLNKPFIGHHDFNSVFYGNMAKNYLRFGFLKTKLGQVTSILQENPLKFGYHTHHPPLLPILMGISFLSFSSFEAAGRAVPIAFSLIGVLIFHQLVAKFFSKQIAFFSSLFFILTPMFIYFGKLPVHEPLVLGFSISLIYFYFLWVKNRNNKYFFYMIPIFIFAELTGWPSYYLPVIFFIHSLFFVKESKIIKKTFILIVLSVFVFSFLLLHNVILTRNLFGGGLLKAFLFRFNIGQRASTYPFTLLEFFRKEALWGSIFFTKTLILLSLFYLINTFLKILKSKKTSITQSIIFVLFFFGIIHPLIFRNAAFLHDYMLFYLLPPLALSGALGLQLIITQVTKVLGLKKIKTLSLITFILVTTLIATEKLKFVDALLNSNMHLDGYILGKIIKKDINPQENILVVSKKFKDYEDIFVNFYSENQKISYTENLNPDNVKNFNWLIFLKNSPEINQADLKNLSKYSTVEKQNFFFIKIE